MRIARSIVAFPLFLIMRILTLVRKKPTVGGLAVTNESKFHAIITYVTNKTSSFSLTFTCVVHQLKLNGKSEYDSKFSWPKEGGILEHAHAPVKPSPITPNVAPKKSTSEWQSEYDANCAAVQQKLAELSSSGTVDDLALLQQSKAGMHTKESVRAPNNYAWNKLG